MAYDAGTAFIQVVPSFKGFETAVRDQLRKAGIIGANDYSGTFNAEVERQTRKAKVGPDDTAKQGERAGGQFADSFKRRVEAALKSLPDIKINAESSDADLKIAAIRAQLEELRTKRIGIDIDEGLALAQIESLKAQLAEVADASPSIQVRADAEAAKAKLDEIRLDVDRLDGKQANIKVDVNDGAARAKLLEDKALADSIGGGGGGIGLLGLGALASPALIPAGAAAAGGLAGIATVAGVGAAAVGVLGLGLAGIPNALKAIGSQSTATAAAQSGAARQVQSAEASLANARASAASGAIQSAESVANARRGLADAERSAASSVQGALANQALAERSLTDAEVAAKDAENALTDARKAAKQQLEDLTLQVKDGALTQRQAVLDVQTAQQSLNATLSNPAATELQRQQAQLTYDQAVQHLTDLKVSNGRLVDQQKAAAKAGIDGSTQVVTAQRGVVQANRNVADAQQKVALASKAVAEAQRAGAESIAKAQQAVGDALRAQSDQQRQAAFSIAQAQQGVAAALQASQVAAASANKGMAGLSTTAIAFAHFVHDTLSPALDTLRATAQKGLLPGLEDGLKAILPLLPTVNTLVGNMARAMGNLFREAGKALTSPFWVGFFQFMSVTAGPVMETFGQILGNLVTGFAGLIEAFFPVTEAIGSGLLGLSQAFADFGKGAGSDSGFQHFLSYVMTAGKAVWGTLGAIAGAVVNVVTALAPFGLPILAGIKGLAEIISGLSPTAIYGIATAIGALWAATLGPVSLIALGLAALGVAAVYAYNHSKTFHDFVDLKLLPALSSIAGFIRRDIVPALKTFGDYIAHTVAPILGGIFKDALDGIRSGFQRVSQAVADNRPQLRELAKAFGALVKFVVEHVLPLFGPIFQALFDGVGRMLSDVVTAIGWVVRGFNGLLTGILSAYGKILDGASWAFGWIPGIGPKLDAAKKQFRDFQTSVNNALNGIDDKTITLSLAGDAILQKVRTDNAKRGIPGGMATGGPVHGPGGPTSDSIPVWLSNGEHVITAAEVQKAGGHTAIESWRKAIRGYATGGPVTFDMSTSFPKASAVWAPGLKVLQDFVASLTAGGNGPQVPFSGSQGVGQWSGLVAQVLGMLHQSLSLVPAVLRRIGFESGGNPNAINLTDSNAAAGHPSQGLMQVIPGTFAAYAGPFQLRTLTDPLANIYAGLNYALHRYGSIGAIDPLVRPRGYDSGGWLPPGAQVTYNGLGKPEAILTPSQWSALSTAAARGSAGGQFTGELYLDSGEFLGMVHGIAKSEVNSGIAGVVETVGRV